MVQYLFTANNILYFTKNGVVAPLGKFAVRDSVLTEGALHIRYDSVLFSQTLLLDTLTASNSITVGGVLRSDFIAMLNKVDSVLISGGNLIEYKNGTTKNRGAVGGGGSGVDTLWTANHDANHYDLRNVNKLSVIYQSGGGGGNNYATWNPSDKAAGLVLSGGNLTSAGSNGSFEMVRATQGISTGKVYIEITNNNTGALQIGIAKASESLNAYVGAGPDGWSYTDAGQKFNNGSASGYNGVISNGETIGMAIDMDNGVLSYYDAGGLIGVAYTGITGTVYPAVGYGFTPSSSTANFGATAFAYSVPSGYTAGLFTSSPPITINSLKTNNDGNVFIGDSATNFKLNINGSVGMNKNSVPIVTGAKWNLRLDTVTNQVVRDSTINDIVYTAQNNLKIYGNIIKLKDTADGVGSQLFYLNAKSAFRAGNFISTTTHPDSVGLNSVAFGINNKSKGSSSSTFGFANNNNAVGSFVSGGNNYTAPSASVSHIFGDTDSSFYQGGTILGAYNKSYGNNNFIAGWGNVTKSVSQTVFGVANDTTGFYLLNGVCCSAGALQPTDPLFTIGNGVPNTTMGGVISRSNALQVYRSGNADVYNVWNYKTDLSASFTNRSLVDKGYVDNLVATGGGLASTNFVYNEEFTGSTSSTYTLANTPVAGKLTVYKNGVKLPLSEFSLSGTVVTLTSARVTGDLFSNDYIK